MKKTLLVALGLVFAGSLVWAANVGTISVKNDFSNGDISSQNQVSYVEFNSVVDTIRGIFNVGSWGVNKIGINTKPSESAVLKVNGLMVVTPIVKDVRPLCKEEIMGTVYADLKEQHLFGCNGKEWVQLDTNEPVCN